MHALAIAPGVAVIPPGLARATAVTFALIVGLAVLLSRRRAISDTTLVGAWWWSVAALVAWGSVEMAAVVCNESRTSAALTPLRLAAITLSLCPVVTLLGAKRPQHTAWNFVVFSLWAIVALPAAENFFFYRGQRVDVGEARGWFLWVLILLPPICFMATRYWLASLILAAGQFVAFSPFLTMFPRGVAMEPGLTGLCISVAAIAIAWLASGRVPAATNRYDRLWLDFRDTFGLLWALRVQERMNTAARQYGWNIELSWRGFFAREDGSTMAEIDPAIEPTLRTTFKGLLRRFVRGAWITQRLASDSRLARETSS